MVIQCPHCQAWLNLPEHVAGSQVRCAICRHAFWAEAPKESVLPGSPPKPKTYDEPRPRARARRLEDFDDYDVRRDVRDSSPDTRELLETAKALARPAGYAMLAALFLTAAGLLRILVIDVFARSELLPQGPEHVAITCCCHLFLYGPMSIFMAIGARSLLRLGSRGLIVTAVVMNFVRFFISGCIVVLNVAFILLTWAPAPDLQLTVGIVANVPIGLANLVAAVMAIRVLTFREVVDAYAARAGEQWQRRGRY